jgi:hypothetical protein
MEAIMALETEFIRRKMNCIHDEVAFLIARDVAR